MLTIILSYYNEREALLHWLETAKHTAAITNDIHYIIVDDCSMVHPAFTLIDPDLSNISLYRFKNDIGYNMYACRNLAMMETKSKWNLLCNVGVGFTSESIIEIYNLISSGELSESNVYDFKNATMEKNNFLITKENFWDAGGYDHEWTSLLDGHTTTTSRILKKQPRVKLPIAATKLTMSKTRQMSPYNYNFGVLQHPSNEALVVPGASDRSLIKASIEARLQNAPTNQQPFVTTWVQLI